MAIIPRVTLHLNPWRKYEDFHHHTLAQRHEYMIGRLENARRREWMWVVVVAGIGFFTDAYAIFSVNMVIPMLGYVYWGQRDGMPHSYQTAMSIVTLGGALVGQIVFGVAADIWGRRKMYGLELVILVFSTLGVAMASSGAENSMSIIAVLLFWRLVMGIGLGADYPLSAVICSEFAPTRFRGRMLAAVFFCQSLGQLAGCLVALVAVTGFRHKLPNDPSSEACEADCIRTVDSIWRLIVGLGAVPAFIAMWFRLTIIESPRYTAEVTKNTLQAAADVSHFYEADRDDEPSAAPIIDNCQDNRDSAEYHELSNPSIDHCQNDQDSITRVDSLQMPPPALGDPSQVSLAASESALPPSLPTMWRDFRVFISNKRTYRALLATSACWFCLDLPFYGLGLITPRIVNTIWFGSKIPETSVFQYLLQISYQSMVVVSSGEVVGSLLTILTIDKLGRRNIQLNGFFWLFILTIVIGTSFKHLADSKDSSALIVLYIISQIFFNFGPNTTTYIIPAELFPTRFRCTCHGISAAAGKLGSIIAQCFLNYVSFGHDANWEHVPDWLGYALLCLSFFMLVGLLVTYFCIPDIRDSSGQVKSLEELSRFHELVVETASVDQDIC
ncbi:hypothetical protein ASPZODRAFT_89971 [Penicilliopsis zonata CBS 506.65]|uniref:Major facilitator superfamily (MFS) profile domain-containing protein n=1 Tax=Penicilliopsis zonata CBS 506.65 TaxID=1073090 RepID=A0A1L9SSE1_9EURO|nr:hypothetical protein ASPZODRAFT_89971 [Penicilliopsis zonata CBS 506.65]OJJ50120.1 hypothetical protein ASPZODRAFT_89971 [Penicilliopsis zonata CBS 506.65]